MRALRYAFDEAIASLWRGRSRACSPRPRSRSRCSSSALSHRDVQSRAAGAEWSRSAELSVYLNDAGDAGAERTAIEGAIEPGDIILARDYVSKADALARFKQTFADLASRSKAGRQPAAGFL